MGRDWDGAKGHPKPSPTQGYGHGWALNIHSVRVSSRESGLGVSGLALPQVRMLQLKPQDRQGEGGDGSCAKPSLLGREKSQRIWGADPLHVHPGPAVIEWDPYPISSISMALLSVTSATAAVPAKLQSWSQHLPALHCLVPGGPTQGRSPHPFVPAREFFCRLWPRARGKGRGSVSIAAGSRQGWRVPTLLPSTSVPRAASHPAWGPGKRRREMSRSWGSARKGSMGRNT